jgi:hypothetical protein
MRLLLLLFFLTASFSTPSSATTNGGFCDDALTPNPSSDKVLNYFSVSFEVQNIDAHFIEASISDKGKGQRQLILRATNRNGQVVFRLDNTYSNKIEDDNTSLDGVYNLSIGVGEWWRHGPVEVYQVLFKKGHLIGVNFYKYKYNSGKLIQGALITFDKKMTLDDLDQLFQENPPED